MLRDEIPPFVDGNNLVAPHLTGPIKGSDNGVCYTSEYYAILKKSGQLTDQDRLDFQQRIGQCINSQGMLCRVPIGQEDGQEQVDDYYGALNGCKQTGNTKIPRQFLWAMIKNLGFMDNDNPGKLGDWASFMPRQPQMLAAMIAAAFPSFSNPLHFCIRLLAWPLFFIAAMIIFVSCIEAPASDADSRRLSWHLIQTVKSVSLMCKFSSLFWYKRLHNTYGIWGMRGVAAKYYQPKHPFITYWID